MDHEIYEWIPKARERGINRNVHAKDLHPRAYVFSPYNEKVRVA